MPRKETSRTIVSRYQYCADEENKKIKNKKKHTISTLDASSSTSLDIFINVGLSIDF